MQVSEHVHALKIPFRIPIAPGVEVDRFVYAFLIVGPRIALVDAGVAGSDRIVFDYLQTLGRRPDEVDWIVLTHAHPDHIGAARTIREAGAARVAAHPAERAWIEDVDLQFRQRPVPGFHTLVAGSVPVDRDLEDGGVLDLGGGLTLDVRHTPGHSAGSVSLRLNPDGVLFTGDAVPLPGDMPIYDDALASVQSIGTLKALDGVSLVLAAWDDPRDVADARRKMDDGLAFLQRIHEAVAAEPVDGPDQTSLEWCGRVLDRAGVPRAAANPLVLRSLQANLRIGDRRDLLDGNR